MHADTSGLRAVATAHARHAADLDALASALAAAAPPVDAFGSVGSRFLAAVAEALTAEARAATRLGGRVATASDATSATAAAFADVDHRVGQAVDDVGL